MLKTKLGSVWNQLKLRKLLMIPTLSLLTLVSASSVVTFADESTSDQIKDTGTNVKRDSKKGVRKFKRKARQATGNDSVGKDIKDGVNDVGDDIGAASEKAKRKLEH